MTQSWGKERPEFVVGEPVTRTLSLQLKGIEAAQLAPTTIPDIIGLRVYPEQPNVQESTTVEGYQVERVERFGLVPSKPGSIELPPVRIRWWDTTTNQERVAELPAETITVLPGPDVEQKSNLNSVESSPLNHLAQKQQSAGAGFSNQSALEGSEQGINWLVWTNLFWMTVFIILIFIWWRSSRAKAQNISERKETLVESSITEKQAFKRLEQACLSGDLLMIRASLHDWLSSRGYRDASGRLSSLSSFEQFIQEATSQDLEGFNSYELQELLGQLDKGIYGRTPLDTYPAEKLLEHISQLRKSRSKARQMPESQIPALYS